MVSGIVSFVQLTATELALKAIEAQQAANTNSSTSTNEMDADNASTTGSTPSDPQALFPHDSVSFTDVSESDISGDITTSEFMKSLKAQLLELSKNPDSTHQGTAMLQALDAGTLKVFDPIEGIAVKAWNAEAGGQTTQSTAINAIGWSQFLKQHVKRENGNAYAKDERGNYIDAISGESAYFETVGSKYYYFTWSQGAEENAATIAA